MIQEAINDDFSARKDGDRGGDVAMVGGNGWVAVAKCICFGTTFRLLNVWRPSSVHFHESFRVKGSGRRSVSAGHFKSVGRLRCAQSVLERVAWRLLPSCLDCRTMTTSSTLHFHTRSNSTTTAAAQHAAPPHASRHDCFCACCCLRA